MANYTTVDDLKADVLTRGNEATDGTSSFDARIISYLNRTYFEAWFKYVWPWTIKWPPFSLNLVAHITDRTVTITKDSTAVTFDANITPSVQDRKLLVGGAWYRISAHTAGTSTATLASAFQEDTVTAAASIIYQDEYQITATDFAHVKDMYDPLRAYWLDSVSMRDADITNQLASPIGGDPDTFAMLTDDRVIFNRYPTTSRRVEVWYQFFPPDLAAGGTPDWPRWRRYMLADGTLLLLHIDKNDERAIGAAQLYNRGLDEVLREHTQDPKARGHARASDTIT